MAHMENPVFFTMKSRRYKTRSKMIYELGRWVENNYHPDYKDMQSFKSRAEQQMNDIWQKGKPLIVVAAMDMDVPGEEVYFDTLY